MRFEGAGEETEAGRQREAEPEPRGESVGESIQAATARYDELIDKLKGQLRQVRIELRKLPQEADRARARLQSMRASEDELRRKAFERVVFRWPQPEYEDFDAALEEALERQAVRDSLVEEIEANERAVARLEAERAELEEDLEQALELKEQARREAIRP